MTWEGPLRKTGGITEYEGPAPSPENVVRLRLDLEATGTGHGVVDIYHGLASDGVMEWEALLTRYEYTVVPGR